MKKNILIVIITLICVAVVIIGIVLSSSEPEQPAPETTPEQIQPPTVPDPIPFDPPSAPIGNGCENLCGDGTCQEVVCLAVGCPCSESPTTCPQDCR